MKNFMGLVWDRGFMHNNNLDQSIADAVLFRKPDLNIVDAYLTLVANGPRGVSLDDVTNPKQLLLSRDIVAIDAASAAILKREMESKGHQFRNPNYVRRAADMGIGEADLTKLNIARLAV
jgi:uncharacterized protein (DUF362 family)